MRNRYFWIKIINLILILALIAGYQIVSRKRADSYAAALKERQKEAAAVERKNAEAAAAEGAQDGGGPNSEGGSESEGGPNSEGGAFKDGTYTGSGDGYGGKVEMKVVIKGGAIESIETVSASGEDAAYWESAQAIIPAIIAAQDPNVDTISGATFSSTGIKNAVITALQQAVEQ